jgi:hypothetical protein
MVIMLRVWVPLLRRGEGWVKELNKYQYYE